MSNSYSETEIQLILNKITEAQASTMTMNEGELYLAPDNAVYAVNNVSPVNGNVTLSIPAAQVNSDWNATSGLAQILNKPNLATVATSGSYNDLSNKPTIPDVEAYTAAEVQTLWSSI